MSDDKLVRLLALMQQRLKADDARIEIGGEPPTDALWASIGEHRRVVMCFDGDPPEDAQEHLDQLVEAFTAVGVDDLEEGTPAPSDARGSLPPPSIPAAMLDEELYGVCVRAGALCALLIDSRSPVLWGKSHADLAAGGEIELMVARGRPLMNAESFEAVVGQPGIELLRDALGPGAEEGALKRLAWACRAVARVRGELDHSKEVTSNHATDTIGLLVRVLGGVYVLLLVFDGRYSELRAEGVVRRASHHLEKLIASLPPMDPPPRGGKLIALKPPR